MTTTAEGARREEFAAAYGDEWAGRDTKQSTTERREGFAAAYGDEWAGRDTVDNLGPGMVPNADAAAGMGFEGYYSNANPEHNGLDVKESTEERREGFAAAYGDEWAGRDTKVRHVVERNPCIPYSPVESVIVNHCDGKLLN